MVPPHPFSRLTVKAWYKNGGGKQNLKQFPIIFHLLELKLFDLYKPNSSTFLSFIYFQSEFSKAGFNLKIEIVCACTKFQANQLGSDGDTIYYLRSPYTDMSVYAS